MVEMRPWMPRGYSVLVDTLPCEPGEWQWCYWKLFWGNERVNGGICFNYDDGYSKGCIYAHQHDTALMREKYFWDEESGRWMLKSTLGKSSTTRAE